MSLDTRQRAALAAICATFAPGDGAAVPPAEAVGAAGIAEALAGGAPRAADRKRLERLLSQPGAAAAP